jgi:serpin B
VNDLVASLSPDAWSGLVGAADEHERAHVALPKFALEWEARLNAELQALGIRSAFSDETADFSRLSPAGSEPGGLRISEVKQKTFVDVNEEGTEAAAATSVTIVESLPPSFRVDRPFVFAIRERLSGAILFVGKVVDPTA